VYRCQSSILAAHASTLGDAHLRQILADALAAAIRHQTGQPIAVDPRKLRCTQPADQQTTAVLTYHVEYDQ
jgi:hypothetical protein